MKKENIKIIFLGIDGVLNGIGIKSKCMHILNKIFHNNKVANYNFDIDKYKIRLLSRICKKTNAKIVISSYTKDNLLDDHNNRITNGKRSKQFWKYIDKYKIDVIGKAHNDSLLVSTKEDNIINWLSKNQDKYNIITFIILDDEEEHLSCFRSSNLVKTSNFTHNDYNIMPNFFKISSGLNRKYTKEAIRKLNYIE